MTPLDAEGRREFLKDYDIRVKATNLDGSAGIHLVIDGVDHGVFD